ncbi:hypothetical protein FACS1894108_05400 [Planctomycetales bacterium]|nr:hypothetical protein FACS1894108_05400 [Planctomycetales bacterium]
MSIKITCNACGRAMNIKDELSGKKIRCPACQTVLTVAASTPAAPALVPVVPAETSAAPSVTRIVAAVKNRENDTRLLAAAAPAASAHVEITKFCPGCKQKVPRRVPVCPHCQYHFKLRRKVGAALSEVIKQADNRAQGLNENGAGRAEDLITREKREAQTRRVARWMKIGAAAVALVVAGLIANLIYGSVAATSLAQLRTGAKLLPLRADNPASFDPRWIYLDGDELLTLSLPITSIQVVNLVKKLPDSADDAVVLPDCSPSELPARLAETVFAPFVDTLVEKTTRSRYSVNSTARTLPALINRINVLGGPFTPQALSANAPARVFIWRKNAVTASGGLRGALLALSPDHADALIAAVKKWRADTAKRETNLARARRSAEQYGTEALDKRFPPVILPTVRLSAKLSFLPFVNRDLRSGNAGYSGAVMNGAAQLRDLQAPPRTAAELQSIADPKNLAAADYYFAPVLLVENLAITAER